MKRLGLALSALLLLAGCGEDTLNGEVVDKNIHSAYSIFVPITSCYGSNPTVCTTTIIPFYVPPCYEIEVHGADDKSTGSTCISPGKWETITIGDHYTGADVDPEDQKEKA